MIGLMAMAPRVHADPPALPIDVQVDLFSKVLPYDKGFPERKANGLTVAVVFVPKDDASRLAKDSVLSHLQAYARIARHPVKTLEVPEDLLPKTDGIDVVWLCSGVDVEAVLLQLERTGALGVTAEESAVEAGIPLGLLIRGQRPRVAVNLASAERLGVRFDARLLRLAEIVGASDVSTTDR